MKVQFWGSAFIVAFSIITLFNSCTAKRALLNKEFRLEEFYVNGVVSEIEIIDLNTSGYKKSIIIPMFTSRHDNATAAPILNQTQKERLKNQIRMYFKGYDNIYSVRCYLQEGIKQFKSGFFEKEYARVTLRTEIIKYDKTVVAEGIGFAELKAQSFDASDKYLSEIYDKCLDMALYNCFKSISSKMK
jgi:hypothetical protein